jgi:S-adenosylmethionine:tRNA ribosyltransferase-isomerase
VRLVTGDTLTIGEAVGEGTRAVILPRDPDELMTQAGEMPLPPYITARGAPDDRYQTVYADPPGSAAAPTAGLHFTPLLLDELMAAGVERATVTLHVGLDTFQPLEGTFVDEHRIHREWYVVPPTTHRTIESAKAHGRRVVAVGTTTARVLETMAMTGEAEGWTDLYILPPHAYRSVDALITNFHLPRSSLLLLVTAFVQDGMAGTSPLEARDTLLAAYRSALERGFRFYSFGDAMLIA